MGLLKKPMQHSYTVLQREDTETHREIEEARLFSRFSVNVRAFSVGLRVVADWQPKVAYRLFSPVTLTRKRK
jgi:hypothetical protein